MADVTIDLEDDEDSSIDEDTEQTLAKYSPSVEDVRGNENEQSRTNTKTDDVVSGQRSATVMDHSASSGAKDTANAKYDQMKENVSHQLRHPSQQQTSFNPKEGKNFDGQRMYKVHHSTTNTEVNETALVRQQNREADIEILEQLFNLTERETEYIDIVQKHTNLRNHGSPRYENLLLASLRYVYRANRDFALKEGSIRTHEEASETYYNLLSQWQCTEDIIDRLYNTVVRENFNDTNIL